MTGNAEDDDCNWRVAMASRLATAEDCMAAEDCECGKQEEQLSNCELEEVEVKAERRRKGN